MYAPAWAGFYGCKSPVCDPVTVVMTGTQILAESKGVPVRERPEEAGVQKYEPEFIPMLLGETETAYKAVQVEGANL